MSARVLLANLAHETHCFAPGSLGPSDFRMREGEAVLSRRGDRSAVDGLLSVAEEEGWALVPAADYAAPPGPTVEREVFERFWASVASRLDGEGLDAVLMTLHGAMVCEGLRDVEGELLTRLRDGVGAIPIVFAFDLHATVTEAMLRGADAMVCFRENPHTDTMATGRRAARLLARMLGEGLRTAMVGRRVPVVWPPSGTGTADPPMRELCQAARDAEAASDGVLAVNVVGGFAYADAPGVGVHLSAVVRDDPEAREAGCAAVDALGRIAWTRRAEGLRRFPTPAGALRRRAGAGAPVPGRPDLLVEPADNIGGGATGDATGVLRALLDVAEPSLIVLADPESVAALADLPVGTTASLAVGGRANPFDEGPVELEAVLLSRSDGRFRLEDEHSHAVSDGMEIEMGPCAVVRSGPVTILLTSRATVPFDLGQLRSQALDPAAFALIGVKAAVGHRRAYDPVAGRSFEVETRALCPSDLSLLDHRHLTERLFPFDPDLEDPDWIS